MSVEAVAWAADQLPPKGRCKELLMSLAAYADAEGVCWAAVATLGLELQLSDRQVQRLLRQLEDVGLIAQTGRQHHRNVPFYALALHKPGQLSAIRAARRAARRAAKWFPQTGADEPANGDIHVTVETANGDIHVTPNGDIHVTQRSREEQGSSNELPNAGARETDFDPDFEAVLAAWGDHSPGRVSRKLAGPVWRTVCNRIAPDRLAKAALRYLVEDADAQRLGATNLDRWLSQDRWESWLGVAVVVGSAWPGPPALRAAVVGARGEAFAASYLDRSRYDADRRALLTRTGLAADSLRGVLTAEHWAALGVDRIEKGE